MADGKKRKWWVWRSAKPLSAIKRSLPSAIRHPPSAICHPPSAIRRQLC